MWYLDSESDQRLIYIISDDKDVTIGRTADVEAACFTIADDPSISRKHAILMKKHNGLFLKDLGSRYGTFINNNEDKIECNVMIKLNDRDVVKFGKMGSKWKVHLKSFVTCTSTLKGENFTSLKQCLESLSVQLNNEWDDECTFLTMPAITLTMKVVFALVQGAYIVNVDFWNDCLNAVKNNKCLPDPKNYTPQIVESTLNNTSLSFFPDIRRRTIFKGKKFVFFSKRQFEMYKTVLNKTSATPMLISESKMTKSSLCENNVIVVQYNMNTVSQETQSQRNMIQDIINYLKNKGKRVIADAEIGLAVLNCSNEKYCNPEFSFPSELLASKQTEVNVNAGNVLAKESQEPSHEYEIKLENVIINESTSLNTTENNSKRKKCDDTDLEENPNKKLAMNQPTSNTFGGNKRKIDDETKDDNSLKKIATESPSHNDSQDGFNFINNIVKDSVKAQNETAKRLNLKKPQKRKLNNDENEDDLFQFVQDKAKIPCHKKSSRFSSSEVQNNEAETYSENICPENKSLQNDEIDITALRGSKLEELMKSNEKLLSMENTVQNDIKKELVDKFCDLYLGTTIVTIKKELIVKKEPIKIEEHDNQLKNFKKFKKVWPVKMQVTVIPRSSMNSLRQHDSSIPIENKS